MIFNSQRRINDDLSQIASVHLQNLSYPDFDRLLKICLSKVGAPHSEVTYQRVTSTRCLTSTRYFDLRPQQLLSANGFGMVQYKPSNLPADLLCLAPRLSQSLLARIATVSAER
jgi:hypothetical protein